MIDVSVPTGSNHTTRFFDKQFLGVELALVLFMAISVPWFSSTEVWRVRAGERADVRVVADLGDYSYEVVYADSVVVLGADEGNISVGDTISVLVDPDDPDVMVTLNDVSRALGFVAVVMLAPFAFPVGRLLYLRRLRRVSIASATPPVVVMRPVARDEQADASR